MRGFDIPIRHSLLRLRNRHALTRCTQHVLPLRPSLRGRLHRMSARKSSGEASGTARHRTGYAAVLWEKVDDWNY